MDKKFHYNYQIININNHKRYIGTRSCTCWPTEDNNYFGSSKHLKQDIHKEGKELFRKEIIAIWDTRELAIDFEIKLHHYFEVSSNPNFYNQAKQTSTSYDRTGSKHSKEAKEKLSNKNIGKKLSTETKLKIGESWKETFYSKIKTIEDYDNWYNKKFSKDVKQKMSDNHANVKGKNNPNYGNSFLKGRPKSIEHRKKLSESKKGELNPMYGKKGTMLGKKGKDHPAYNRKWINKDGITKMVYESEIDYYIKNGWKRGRK